MDYDDHGHPIYVHVQARMTEFGMSYKTAQDLQAEYEAKRRAHTDAWCENDEGFNYQKQFY